MNLIQKKDIIQLKNSTLLMQDTSNYYIQISDFPQYFGYGYNSFLVGAKQQFFKLNSMLVVSLSDVQNNPIPIEITQYRQRGQIRCSVYIQEGSIPVGFGTLMLVGTLQHSIHSEIPLGWKDKTNIKHQRHVYINSYQKTISKLRFKQPPKYQINLNQKQAYSFKVMDFSQTLRIKDIKVEPKKRQMFMLKIEPVNQNTSLFHEKLLNYPISDDFLACIDPKCIFRGQVDNMQEVPKGSYTGKLIGNVQSSLQLLDLDVNIMKGIVSLTNTMDYKLLEGYDIDILNLSSQEDYQYREGETVSQVKIKNPSNFTIQEYDEDFRIVPRKHSLIVDYATNVHMETSYFQGQKLDEKGSIYAQTFTPYQQVDGVMLPKDILDPDKAEPIYMKPNTTYEYITITEPCEFEAGSYILMQGVNIKNGSFSNKLNSLIMFTSFSGKFFSKTITTQMGDEASYVDGCLIGEGHFTASDNNGIIYRNYQKTRGKQQEQTQIGNKYKIGINDVFEGKAYNVEVDASYFSGSILDGRIIQKVISTPYYDTFGMDITNIQDFDLKFNYLKASLNEIDELKIRNIKEDDKIPIDFQITLVDGNVKLIGDMCQVVQYQQFLQMDGSFYISQLQPSNPSHTSFSGLYQNKQTIEDTNIEIYQILQGSFNMKDFDFFKTKGIIYNQSQPETLYIPNSIFKDSVDLEQIYKHFYNEETQDYRIDLNFKLRDELSRGDLLVNKGLVPLEIKILQTQMYSGFWQGIKVMYHSVDSSTGTQNSQLLTLIQLKDHEFPTICNVNIPIDTFASGGSFYFEFIPYNTLGDEVPSDFIYKMYDFQIDEQFMEGINGYRLLQGNIDDIEFPVKSVNQKTGHVVLRAQDILTTQQLINVNRKITVSNDPPEGDCQEGDIWIIPLQTQ